MMIFRIHAIRDAIFAGERVTVLAEQIGGNFPTRAAAEAAAKQSGLKCRISYVGGIDQPKPLRMEDDPAMAGGIDQPKPLRMEDDPAMAGGRTLPSRPELKIVQDGE